ncbi:MAG: DJ-1/PfpI family protein [candidate division KSB1 bacterium]|nr:DJ-1/PfpI family protein [candidate division KSB1 bacterium]MDQ7063315.1 DJ-1/PfpI family protein [candidate division KSB1 bacterium]
MSKKANSRVLLVIAADAFDDRQYAAVRDALEKAGIQVDVASTVKKGARGLGGMRLDPDFIIDEVDAGPYAGVVFIGGHGCSQYWHDVYAHEIVRTIYENGGLVAAIGRAPVVLGEAGILGEHNTTGAVGIYEKMVIFSKAFTANKIEVDGNVITAENNNALEDFKSAIVAWFMHGDHKPKKPAAAQAE